MTLRLRVNNGSTFTHHADGTVSTPGGSTYNQPANPRTPQGGAFVHPNVTGGTIAAVNPRTVARVKAYEDQMRAFQVQGAVMNEFRLLRAGRADGPLNTDDVVRLVNFADGNPIRKEALRALAAEPVMTPAARTALTTWLERGKNIHTLAFEEARRNGRAVDLPETAFPVGYANVLFAANGSDGTARLVLENGVAVERLRMRSDGNFEGVMGAGKRVVVDAHLSVHPVSRTPQRTLTISIYDDAWALRPESTRTLTAATTEAPALVPQPGRHTATGEATVKALTQDGRVLGTETLSDFRQDFTLKKLATPRTWSMRLEGLTVRLRDRGDGHITGTVNKPDGTRLTATLSPGTGTLRVDHDRRNADGERSLTSFVGRTDAFRA